MRRSLLDIQVAAGAVAVAVAGLSLGGAFAWGGMMLAAGGAMVYSLRLRPPTDQAGEHGPDLPAPGVDDVLWADAEQALRVLDRYPAEGELADSVVRLARLGRRAVERGRRRPADPAAGRTRHVLCLAAETLSAYTTNDRVHRQRRHERLQRLLDEAAETIARDAESVAEDQALCVRLRVLEQELKTMPERGTSDGFDDPN